MESASLNVGASALERRGENHGSGERQGVSGVSFGGIDVHPLVSIEKRKIKPGAIGEQGVISKRGDRGLEMEAAGDRNAEYVVAIRLNDRRQLRDAFGVAACGEADEKFAADAQDVAAFNGARETDFRELAKRCKRRGD